MRGTKYAGHPVRAVRITPPALRPFLSGGQRGQRFSQAAGARFGTLRHREPHDVFALIGGREFAESLGGGAVFFRGQGVFEKGRHRPLRALHLRRGRNHGDGIEFHGGVEQRAERAAIQVLERCQSFRKDAGIVGARREQLRRIGQLGSAEEREAHVAFAGAQTAHQLAPGEAEHVPLDGLREVRLPGENPFTELLHDRRGKVGARLQPFGWVMRAGARAVHRGSDTETPAG
jgi:hypothetical protein